MIDVYFGLPRSGKTTLLCKIALKAVKGKRYKNVYANIHTGIEGVKYVKNEWIGHYQLEDGLLLIDEATIFADNRDYKNFSKQLVQFFMLHGHYRVDVALFTQKYNGLDVKIRNITNNVYYLYKPFLFGKWITKYYKVPYGVVFPSGKDENGKKQMGDITEGYYKANFITRLFSHIMIRKKYYKYFDSWEAPQLPPLPLFE